MGVAWRGVTGLQASGEIIYHRSAVSRSQLAQSCRNLAVWRCRWTSLHRRLLYRSSGRALTDAGVLGSGRRAIHRSARAAVWREELATLICGRIALRRGFASLNNHEK